ncbi:amidase [Pseudomonas sp. S04]|uniref:amidase n=1 Tax=unclassified Pseudomonas TaxID=196821 RepID=UPI0013200ED7|nr:MULTISPECIES: amidase [unclassified Pseudomonas]QHD03641.1 amidase [Pseudomonas sp. S04]QHF36126.1 amidase [Pseudomonas sp. S19]
MNNFNKSDATVISEMVRSQIVSAETIAEHFLERVESQERSINAFVSFDPNGVRSQACQIQKSNVKGLLAGVPVGIKDIYDTVDHPTRFYSPIYEDNCPSRDAHVVSLLRQAGAVIMGKTHTTEFAYMHTGPTCNPHDLDRTPGSSSAGSAAGMAAGFFPIALGTQTAGSLIKPASYCGLYAFKPSYGLVSLEGVKPLAPSFDTVGWYGRSVRDLELMAQVLIPGFPKRAHGRNRGSFGFCRTARWDQVDEDVAKSLEAAVENLRLAGHQVSEVLLPEEFAAVFDDHLLINDCEGARSLSKERQMHPDKLSEELLAMIERASLTTWEQESAAKKRLAKLATVLEPIFKPFDAVLGASCGIVAPLGLGATGPSDFSKFWMAFGLPQINLPLVRNAGTLPAGLQVIGGFRNDSVLLQAAQGIDMVLRDAG